MAKKLTNVSNIGLGTPAVFFTAISTILGAIMFLRFGYAVGNLGLFQSILVIIVGHLVTIPTALAISEIATNQKVEGGGLYFMMSRSFGLNIGGAIGIALFLSQAISIAFYTIAFAQAFEPLFLWVLKEWGLYFPYQTQIISIPSTLFLILLVMYKGASIGLKLLYIVVAILFLSLVLFFAGSAKDPHLITSVPWKEPKGIHDDFFHVFAICFPGFTGMAAGVGLSGDLKKPSRSIPLGTMLATIVGMIIYLGIVIKLAVSAPMSELADPNNQLIMQDIALWGPIIPIGLAAASFSSAIGSILVAPRTLQAIGNDKILPGRSFNTFLSKIKKENNEPINATLITSIIAFGIVLINDVDIVAEIISIFFMITYGAMCIISFFEHFAADPAYRPSFKSKWYLSLIGAILCFIFMFQMNTPYAVIGVILMVILFIGVNYSQKNNKSGMSVIFQGVISQLSRKLQVFLQKVQKDQSTSWRPSIICISDRSFERFSAFDLLRWISRKYGFGTYIHMISGYLSKESNEEAKQSLERLIKMADHANSNIYLDTLVSPNFSTAVAQSLQLPGISGKDNNMIMLEFSKGHPEELDDFMDNFNLIKSTGFDICLLGSSIKNFGFKRSIHIWITTNDYANANLMILMGYIILGHPEWRRGEIKIFALYPEEKVTEEKKKLMDLVNSGRLPISSHNIEMIPKPEDTTEKEVINNNSRDADLTLIGFRSELLKNKGVSLFEGYDAIGDILFMTTEEKKEIK